MQLKGNQPKLQTTMTTWVASMDAPAGHQETDVGKRNRIESRATTVWLVPPALLETEWSMIRSLIRVERQTDCFNTTDKAWHSRQECAWYVSTMALSAAEAAKAIRAHWQIENALHHVRDVGMGEDASQIRKSAGVFAQLRTLSLNWLRHAGYQSIKAARQMLGWDSDKLLKLIQNGQQ